jgi:hypothetical protein
MLHEVAASDLELSAIFSPLRKILRRVKTFTGSIEAINLDQKCVAVSSRIDGHVHELPYDYLIVALGSSTNFHGLPIGKSMLTIKTLDDAIELRNPLIGHLEEASSECSAEQRLPLLAFVVARCGHHFGLGRRQRNEFANRPPAASQEIRTNLSERIPSRDATEFGRSVIVPQYRPTRRDFIADRAARASRGRCAARIVSAQILGLHKKPFRFATLGRLAVIGNRTGVAKYFRDQFLRIFRLVALVDDLPLQVAAFRKAGTCGPRLDARPVLRKGLCLHHGESSGAVWRIFAKKTYRPYR